MEAFDISMRYNVDIKYLNKYNFPRYSLNENIYGFKHVQLMEPL